MRINYNKNKLNNRSITIDGITFQSIREGNRYCELKLLQKAGKISNLELQKKYELIPAYYETVETGEYYKIGAKKGQRKTKRICVEQSLCYNADFVYDENGKTIVEDAKGFKTEKYIIKRKLMLHKYGIRVKEV